MTCNSSMTYHCVASFLIKQEPRAFPREPEFNAEEDLNEEDLEPIYNGEQMKHEVFRTVPPFGTAHTFCASRDIRFS